MPAGEVEELRRHLEPVPSKLKQVFMVPEQPMDSVYFIEAGTVSVITTLEDGSRMELGMVGPEGMLGLPVLLGAGPPIWEGMVQIEGTVLRLRAPAFRRALGELPSLLPLLLRYVDAFDAQVAQSAACNGRHEIEQRLARWILTTHDRVGGDSFLMTQEFMSTMLGVRRPGVTLAVGALQRAGLVRHARGTMHVLNRPALEGAACECYEIVRQRYMWLTEHNS